MLHCVSLPYVLTMHEMLSLHFSSQFIFQFKETFTKQEKDINIALT